MPLRTIELDKGRCISVNDFGSPDGIPVVVHHGMVASIQQTALFAALVEAGRRVIALARPGYGASSPVLIQDVAAWGEIAGSVLSALRVSTFDILGISSGAPYAYALAAWRQEQTRNVFIFSGTPALYDERVAALWPHPLKRDAALADLRLVARRLLFSGLTPEQRQAQDVLDTAAHDCFGMALDLKIRCIEWGFDLSDVSARVFMQHSITDSSVPFAAAKITASLLEHCILEERSEGGHFSDELLDTFLRQTVVPVIDRSHGA